jgi:hypothetical protein
MGAYSSSMSSTFNGFPIATVYDAMSPQLRCPGGRVWRAAMAGVRRLSPALGLAMGAGS